MKELYWITRLDAVNHLLVITIVFTFMLTFFFGYVYLTSKSDERDEDTPLMPSVEAAKYLKKSFVRMIVAAFLLAFVPNTKQALFIYGVGQTIDYIKTDSVAQQLPHDVIEALDEWVKDINPKGE